MEPFFDHAFDFSTAFGEFKGPITFVASSIVLFSVLNNFKNHSVTFDKLLRVLTTSKSRTRLSSEVTESLMLLEPPMSPS